MACSCLERYLEDRFLFLDSQRDRLPWWAWSRRRRMQARIHSCFDILVAARAASFADETIKEREDRIAERADEARPHVSMTPGQVYTLRETERSARSLRKFLG